FLRPAVEASFNSISVDGECSTNDSVLLLANGAAPVERTPAGDQEFALCLRRVCADLARQIVADGEGATVIAEIGVRGAASEAEARAIAERVATSPLVKTALHGHDANWGRIASAAGSARWNGGYARLDPDLLSILIDGVAVLRSGRPTGDEPTLTNGHCAIELDLALGDGAAAYLTTDLSSEYVRINAEYRS
ncbi:MAG TPA: bifunctional ornithine acetyltransferase/N-acetylglutamate synthase, partial [Gaiellaceae bacterium]|nr:bifunctional ornithine acetyltransferase/N-acetylglutamate synthase [Gaiellaceae bacterium]